MSTIWEISKAKVCFRLDNVDQGDDDGDDDQQGQGFISLKKVMSDSDGDGVHHLRDQQDQAWSTLIVDSGKQGVPKQVRRILRAKF